MIHYIIYIIYIFYYRRHIHIFIVETLENADKSKENQHYMFTELPRDDQITRCFLSFWMGVISSSHFYHYRIVYTNEFHLTGLMNFNSQVVIQREG